MSGRRRVLTVAALAAVVLGLAVPVATAVPAQAAVACTALTSPVYERAKTSGTVALLSAGAKETDEALRTGFTVDKGVLFLGSAGAKTGFTTLHRLSNPKTGDLIWMPPGTGLTTWVKDRGYVDQGKAFTVATAKGTGCAGVVRLTKSGMHRYAVTASAISAYTGAGWRNEGIQFYGAAAPAATSPAASASLFSIAQIGDTQIEALPPRTAWSGTRTTYLAQKKAAYDLQYVIHTGDITNWGWVDPSQMAVEQAAMSTLAAAGIPYSISIGNHDSRVVGWSSGGGYGGDAYVNNPECVERFGDQCKSWLLARQTQEINAAFPLSTFTKATGAYEAGKIDNVYSTFTAGGKKWLVLSLELWPRQEVVAWAKTVVASNPDKNVIVQTHHYLNGDGTISTSNGGYGATSPKYLYDNLISQYRNIVMVFSGHTGQAASRVDKGVKGNTIVSFLLNEVTVLRDTNRYAVRIVEIDTAKNTITSRLEIPTTGGRMAQYAPSVTGVTFVG